MLSTVPRPVITAFAVSIDNEIGKKLDVLSLKEQVATVMTMFSDEILQLPPSMRAELDEFCGRAVADGKVALYLKTLHQLLEP